MGGGGETPGANGAAPAKGRPQADGGSAWGWRCTGMPEGSGGVMRGLDRGVGGKKTGGSWELQAAEAGATAGGGRVEADLGGNAGEGDGEPAAD